MLTFTACLLEDQSLTLLSSRSLTNASGAQLEIGHVDLSYNVPAANSFVTVTGTMGAFRGKLAGNADLFQASPFTVTGTYHFDQVGTLETHRFAITAVTQASVNPTYVMSAETLEGSILLPNAEATKVTLSQVRSRNCLSVSGA